MTKKKKSTSVRYLVECRVAGGGLFIYTRTYAHCTATEVRDMLLADPRFSEVQIIRETLTREVIK